MHNDAYAAAVARGLGTIAAARGADIYLYYGVPPTPVLEDAKRLYEWVIGDRADSGTLLPLSNGPRVVILGSLAKRGDAGASMP
mgnify:CR=1 FL=1